ncbi:FAD-dependent oxidoreductase [Lactobacillus sp. ESL0791]|uniref:FAD-dependent oxidoreductase n=1 Tax=Lactobacillus sp. ESL0791 TaxID=2983234 RepID=UPI0023F72D45|nr:FAD-dependent oxidoreductase [Lactobacillus sp. ESL0791]MDF7638195.1 FAD-dependent oxidoreductase [Lactobacillus sp. ESL0791]
MQYTKNINWDIDYDVIVAGFGGAGATAARFAADNGAKVLLIDSAPEGHEGGNTRYASQFVAYEPGATAEFKEYLKKLAAPYDYDEELLDTMADGVSHMKEYFEKYLGVEPFIYDRKSANAQIQELKKLNTQNAMESIGGLQSIMEAMPSFPEYTKLRDTAIIGMHANLSDGALYKALQQEVVKRTDKIDVWYNSPVCHLIQSPETKTVMGVQAKRNGQLVNIHANNGVIITAGGFENDRAKLQMFFGVKEMAPLGAMYNHGASINLGLEANANLFHPGNYLSNGIYYGMTYKYFEGKRSPYLANYEEFYKGSIFLAGDDGSRYFKEDSSLREGFVDNNGTWVPPYKQVHPHMIFDQKKYEQLSQNQNEFLQKALAQVTKGDSLEELAGKISADPEVLKRTVNDFNYFAEEHRDYQFNRKPENMTAFDQGPYYAIPLMLALTTTLGGIKRNSKAEVIDVNGNAIPHLYSAGEAGSAVLNLYQGGCCLADCLIFGKIAGENAAQAKADSTTDGQANLNATKLSAADLASDIKEEEYSTGTNQYIGKSQIGMGDEIVVRVTVDDHKNLKNVEVLKQAESDDYGLKAIKELPQEMVKQNSYEVDAVSGASNTSRGLKDAVKNALDKIN